MGNVTGPMNSLIEWINYTMNILSIIVFLLALASFVYNLIVVGVAGTNSKTREKGKRGLLISGIVAMVLPTTSLLIGIIMSLFF